MSFDGGRQLSASQPISGGGVTEAWTGTGREAEQGRGNANGGGHVGPTVNLDPEP
jgi:hypothetical protein